MTHVRRPDLMSRVINGERVILDRERGYVHQLNATASCIWDALDGSRSAEEIARCLEETFEHPPDTVQLLHDVYSALAYFGERGLLLGADVGPSSQEA